MNMYDESRVGKYNSFGRPLSPLLGYTEEELEAERLRLLAEAEARRLAAEEEARRLAAEEAERLRKLAEEEEARRLAEEEARRLLMEAKLREEEEFKRKREEAERLKRLEAERLAALEAERLRLEAERKAKEEAERRAREEAAAKRRAEEEAKKQAILAEKRAQKRGATMFQKVHRGNAARKLFAVKKQEKKEKDENNASVMFQKVQRGRIARAQVKDMKKVLKIEKENKSANMMQKFERGRSARKQVAVMRAEKQRVKEEKSSVLLQSKIRQRAASLFVNRKRAEKRAFEEAERRREEKEIKRMMKCDFDADKVGWDLGDDPHAHLRRPLTYAELLIQENNARNRGDKVKDNLVRKGGKYDKTERVFKQNNWYGNKTEFDTLNIDLFPKGHGAEVGLNSARSENLDEDPMPEVLKNAKYMKGFNFDDIYDVEESNEHKQWPPIYLTDKWDWETYFADVEEDIREEKPAVQPSELDLLEMSVRENKKRKMVEEKRADVYRKKIGVKGGSFLTSTKHPVVPICMNKIGGGNKRVTGSDGDEDGANDGEVLIPTPIPGAITEDDGPVAYVQRLKCSVDFEKFVYFQVPVLDPYAVVTIVVKGLEEVKQDVHESHHLLDNLVDPNKTLEDVHAEHEADLKADESEGCGDTPVTAKPSKDKDTTEQAELESSVKELSPKVKKYTGNDLKTYCDVDLFVSQNSLPSYFKYDWKSIGENKHRLVLFGKDREKMTSKSGSIFVGVYTTSITSSFEIGVQVKSERDVVSSSFKTVQEKTARFEKLLTEYSTGELLTRFNEISSYVDRAMKNEFRHKNRRTRPKKLSVVDRIMAESDDDGSLMSAAGLSQVESGGSEDEEDDTRRNPESEEMKNVVMDGLMGLFQSGFGVSVVEIDNSNVDGEGVVVIPAELTRARDEFKEHNYEELSGGTIDLYNFDEIMKATNERVGKEKRNRIKHEKENEDAGLNDGTIEEKKDEGAAITQEKKEDEAKPDVGLINLVGPEISPRSERTEFSKLSNPDDMSRVASLGGLVRSDLKEDWTASESEGGFREYPGVSQLERSASKLPRAVEIDRLQNQMETLWKQDYTYSLPQKKPFTVSGGMSGTTLISRGNVLSAAADVVDSRSPSRGAGSRGASRGASRESRTGTGGILAETNASRPSTAGKEWYENFRAKQAEHNALRKSKKMASSNDLTTTTGIRRSLTTYSLQKTKGLEKAWGKK